DAAGDPRAPGHPRAWARTRTSGNASHDPAQPAVQPPPMSTRSSFLCWVHGAPCRPDFFNSPIQPALTQAPVEIPNAHKTFFQSPDGGFSPLGIRLLTPASSWVGRSLYLRLVSKIGSYTAQHKTLTKKTMSV